MKTPIVIVGVVLLIIGAAIAGLYVADQTLLYSGIGILIVGLVVAGWGAMAGPKAPGMAGAYSCSKCGMKFNSEAEMTAHSKEKHGM